MPDSQLADRVHNALIQNPHLPRRTLTVEAQQGRVILRGVVRSWYQKQMAQESLLRVEGVHGVENHLEVDSTSLGLPLLPMTAAI